MTCTYKGYVKGSSPMEIEIEVTNPATGHVTTLYLDNTWTVTLGGPDPSGVQDIRCNACKVCVQGVILSTVDDPDWMLYLTCTCGFLRQPPRVETPNTVRLPPLTEEQNFPGAPPVEPTTPEPVDVDAKLKKRRDALFARVFNQ